MTKLLTAAEARELLKNNAELDELIKSKIMPEIYAACNLGLNACTYTLKDHIEVNCHEFTKSELKLANRLQSLGYTTGYGSNYIDRFMCIKW